MLMPFIFIASVDWLGKDWAYRSETAGHVAILKTDVAWNVHHMEKLIVPVPTTVIGDLTAKGPVNRAEKNLLESCGINTLRAASCVEHFSCGFVDLAGLLSMIFTVRQSIFSVLHTTPEHETAITYCHIFCRCCVGIIGPQIQFHMAPVCTANYLQLKEFQHCYEAFLHLVSAFISDEIIYRKAEFMTVLMVVRKVFYFSIWVHGHSRGN